MNSKRWNLFIMRIAKNDSMYQYYNEDNYMQQIDLEDLDYEGDGDPDMWVLCPFC
jgi:hypothetical protein